MNDMIERLKKGEGLEPLVPGAMPEERSGITFMYRGWGIDHLRKSTKMMETDHIVEPNKMVQREEKEMSYDITLVDPVTRETLELNEPHYMRGGTYAIGGSTEMWLNITCNYSRWYYKDGVFPGGKGIRSIYGKTGAESIHILGNAIAKLERMEEDIPAEEIRRFERAGVVGYWLPTRENALRPLHQLLAFAQMRPDGVWEGD